MKTIIFATTNKGKIASLRKALDKAGFDDIEIDARTLDIIEPQADSCEEVALSKARQACKILKRPVLVDDSSFHITALGGFPGVYAKYMNETLGAEGIVEFMKDKEDRSAHFEGVLVYIDGGGEHIFREEPLPGTIATTVHEITHSAPWSVLHKIFIPSGSDKVLGNMSEVEYDRMNQTTINKYTLFVDWLKMNISRNSTKS
jgi:non-canonical purine NTP pyrophosphatase (RdgB/HAM1 family)